MDDVNISYWNYRVVMYKIDTYEKYGIEEMFQYGIHEVYYDNKNNIVGWSKDSINLDFISYRDIKITLKYINKALKMTVLKKDKIDDKDILIDTKHKIKHFDMLGINQD